MFVFTDGAASSNGQRSCKASYGVFAPELEKSRYNGRVLKNPSNQRAELMGICRALEILKENAVTEATIVTDSQYGISCLTSWSMSWKRNGWKTTKGLPVKHSDLIRCALDLLKESPSVKLQHIRSHQPRPSRSSADFHLWEGNRMADELASLVISDRG